MKCERCKKNDATIHLSEIVKDVKSEVHLCEYCARDVGLNTRGSGFSFSLPEMLTFLNVDDLVDYNDGQVCSTCGCSFPEYKREGKLGCPDCYVYLENRIEGIISDYYGEKKYSGKVPFNRNFFLENIDNSLQKKSEYTLAELKTELNQAVNEERYEEAALLRDKINEINKSLGQV
jgi:protein arginine kinase activator